MAERKVELRWEVNGSAAAAQFEQMARSARSASQSVESLRQQMRGVGASEMMARSATGSSNTIPSSPSLTANPNPVATGAAGIVITPPVAPAMQTPQTRNGSGANGPPKAPGDTSGNFGGSSSNNGGSGGNNASGASGGSPNNPFDQLRQDFHNLSLVSQRLTRSFQGSQSALASWSQYFQGSGGAGGIHSGQQTPGGFFSTGGREQLLLNVLMHKGFEKTGLTARSLTMLDDANLLQLMQKLQGKQPAANAKEEGGGFWNLGPEAFAAAGGRFGKIAGRFAGPLAAVGGLAFGANAAHNVDLMAHQGGATYGETGRSLMNSTAVTRTILETLDMFRGRSQNIAKMDHDAQIAEFGRGERMRLGQIDRQVAHDRMMNTVRADVLVGDNRIVAMPHVDRSTVRGEQQFEEVVAKLPAQRQKLELERGLKIEEGQQKGMEEERNKLRAELLQQRMQVNFAENRVLNANGGAEKVKAAAELDRATKNVQMLNQELEHAERRIEQQRAKVIQARGDLNRNTIEQLRTEAQLLERRESKAASQAQRIGAMNPLERVEAMRSLEQYKAQGEFTAPDVRERAARMFPEEVAKMEEGFGKKFIEDNMPKLNQIAPEFRDNLDNVRKDRVELDIKIQKLQIEVNQKLAEEFKEKLNAKEFVDNLRDVIKRDNEALLNQFMNKIRDEIARR